MKTDSAFEITYTFSRSAIICSPLPLCLMTTVVFPCLVIICFITSNGSMIICCSVEEKWDVFCDLPSGSYRKTVNLHSSETVYTWLELAALFKHGLTFVQPFVCDFKVGPETKPSPSLQFWLVDLTCCTAQV